MYYRKQHEIMIVVGPRKLCTYKCSVSYKAMQMQPSGSWCIIDVFNHNLPRTSSSIFVTEADSWSVINILKTVQSLYWINQDLAKQFFWPSSFLLLYCSSHFPPSYSGEILKKSFENWTADCLGRANSDMFWCRCSCNVGVKGHASVSGKCLFTFLCMHEFNCGFNGLHIWEKWSLYRRCKSFS